MTRPLPCPAEHWGAFSRLLDEALALPPAERAAWLAALPPGQAQMRGWLEPVLAQCSAAGPALESPRLPPAPPPQWRAGQTIGPYTLLAPLGQGGMGMVWRARRSDGAYAREVALKLPHPHLLAGVVRERFERERDILASLVHPHIAAFYDAGLDATGQPYLALELVEGQTITEHAQGLPLAARLALFQQVLAAVAYAHSRLVAHRDIKPANVLVSAPRPAMPAAPRGGSSKVAEPHLLESAPRPAMPAAPRGGSSKVAEPHLLESAPRPAMPAAPRGGSSKVAEPHLLESAASQVKLLDFGIAKLLDDPGGDRVLTRESLPATPRYAAPEQRLGGMVTVATDIYALGLMLHELLTGAPVWPQGVPIDTADAADAPLPSRQANSPEQRRALAGDLDAIVHRALQANPGQRYASVADFASDLQRHLRGEPIAARRITPWLRAAKYVRRHRMPVALAAALGLSLVAGVAAVAWQSRQALEQARRAEAVKGFLVSVFEGADPRLAGNRPAGMTPVRELLDRHAQRIETEFATEPLLQLELLRLVSDLYRELDEPQAAQRWRARYDALAPQHLGALDPWVLGSRVEGLFHAYTQGDQAGCRELAGPLGQDITRAGLDGDEVRAFWLMDVAQCHSELAGREADRLQWLTQAEALFAKAVPGSRGHVTVWVEIGNLHTPAGRHEQALQAYRRALALAEALPQRNEAELQTLHGNIGLALQQMGRLDEAAQSYARAAAAGERTVGAAHPSSWDPRVNQLRTLHLTGQRDAAWALLPMLQAAAAGEARADIQVQLASLREHIGERMAAEGRAAEALPWLRSAADFQARAAAYPYAHRRTLRHLGDALDRAGQHDEGGRVLADALRRYEAADTPGSQPLLAARERWARWLLERGQGHAARAQFERVVADATTRTWSHVALAQAGLARAALAQGDLPAAQARSAEALATWAAVTGFRDVRMQAYLWRVRAAVLERELSTRAEAETLWQQAAQASARTDAPQSPTVRQPRRVVM